MNFLIWMRSFLVSLFLVFNIFLTSVLVIVAAVIFKNMKWADHLINFWGRLNLFLFNIRVKVIGEENLPKEGCLLLFNHSSHFDIIILVAVIKKIAHFGAKAELFQIPVFGHALRAVKTLPIHRAERDKVLKLYEDSIARVKAGESFYLAAEGTRQSKPGVGTKFKQGPFIFAMSGEFPIVPIVIRGAAECMPKGHLIACKDKWRHEVTVSILPAISTQGVEDESRAALVAHAQKLMTNAYQNL